MQPLKVLSLFDGISVLRQVFKELETPVIYYGVEINPKARAISRHNHDDIIYLSDVRHVSGADFDLIAGGSPCQDLSIAKTDGKGLEGSKSGLYYEFLRIVNETKAINPNVKILLENVKGKNADRDKISETIGIEPVFINSRLFVRQNRPRYYWFNWQMSELPVEPTYSDSVKYYSYLFNSWRVSDICFTIAVANKLPFCAPFDLGINYRDTLPHYRELAEYRLTIEQLELLQGYPAGYVSSADVAKTHKLEAIGNGWTLPVIKHIISSLYR